MSQKTKFDFLFEQVEKEILESLSKLAIQLVATETKLVNLEQEVKDLKERIECLEEKIDA
jgi:predicted  nucleic acid-binding Zn-ribbon protein